MRLQEITTSRTFGVEINGKTKPKKRIQTADRSVGGGKGASKSNLSGPRGKLRHKKKATYKSQKTFRCA